MRVAQSRGTVQRWCRVSSGLCPYDCSASLDDACLVEPWVDQPWTPVVTLPPVRDGLRALCDGGVADVPQARHLMRNALLDFPTIVPTIACHQRRIGILNALFANKNNTTGRVSCQTRESSSWNRGLS
jgi:hypothetical protein